MPARWPLLAALYGLLLAVALAVALTASPPPSQPADAPASAFSAARAMETVRALTATGLPHPAESADHARVLSIIEDRLRGLGPTPERIPGQACGKRGCHAVVNLLARLPGQAQGPGLVLAAHSDSVPTGPGASDDAAGVATVLEIARALRAGPTPPRPVLLVITDGEELGLLGARAFVEDPSRFADAAVVLNFEARGTGGQTAMFEASDASLDLVSAYGRAVSRPVASSLITTLYKRLPNDTDLTVFRQAGLRGLNFAFADGVWRYHTPQDTADALDARSLQHMGDQGLATARALLALGPTRTPDREAVYFDLFSAHLVTYRASLALPLAIGVAALALLGLGMALLRKRLSALELMQGTGVVLGALVLAVLAGRIAAWLLGPTPLGTPSPLWAWVALLAAGVAGATGLLAVARRTSPLATLAGTTELWVTLAVAISALAPGASHVFAWPALVLAAGLLAAVRDAEPARAAMPAAFVTAVFWVPLMHVLQVMVGASMGPAVTLPATMLVTACAPALVALGGRARWVSPALALVVTVVAIAAWRL